MHAVTFATLLSLILQDNIVYAIEDAHAEPTAPPSLTGTVPTVYISNAELNAEQSSRLRCSDSDLLFVLSYLAYASRLVMSGSANVHVSLANYNKCVLFFQFCNFVLQFH